jgi:hypothetical protein
VKLTLEKQDDWYVLSFDEKHLYQLWYNEAGLAYAKLNEAKALVASGWTLEDFVEKWF